MKQKSNAREMKTKFASQGDIYILPIDKLPDGLNEMKREKGKLIIAHSETGHHHSIFEEDEAVTAFIQGSDLSQIFLEVRQPVELIHERSFDTHESIKFPVGTYQINRQWEKRPEGWAVVQD